MIPQRNVRFTTLICILLAAGLWASAALAGTLMQVRVDRVLDGDTVVIEGGERVRLLGIDAPEKGEPFSELALKRLREMTSGRIVELDVCGERDPYGRMLALIRVGGENVNSALLREGLALPMLIPPCGRPVAAAVLRDASRALIEGKGLYADPEYEVVSHERAADHIGRKVVVKGRVRKLFKGGKAWHLNFEEDWKTDFTAVLFREGRQRFEELGLDPEDLVGTEVLVIGKVKQYNGPEIVLRGPDRILPIAVTAPESGTGGEKGTGWREDGR
ncbi:MAG: thermonuclease family protein [bacterium]|nr:MAG: thermonuclease family protein [bacterium]